MGRLQHKRPKVKVFCVRVDSLKKVNLKRCWTLVLERRSRQVHLDGEERSRPWRIQDLEGGGVKLRQAEDESLQLRGNVLDVLIVQKLQLD